MRLINQSKKILFNTISCSSKIILFIWQSPFWQAIILFPFIVIFFFFFGDRGWFEGDAISQIEGILNFSTRNTTELYRYYWQPLTYELNALLYSFLRSPKFLYYLPHLWGFVDIYLLLIGIYIFSKKRINFLLGFGLLLFLPEIFFCGLYYNSTVFAMLPMGISLVLLVWQTPLTNIPNSLWQDIRWLMIGITSATACLFRFDFLLSVPLLMYLLFITTSSKIKALIFYLLGGIGVLLLSIYTGLFNIDGILGTLSSHYDYTLKSNPHHWNLSCSVTILFTIMNLIIWGGVIVYMTYFTVFSIKHRSWKDLMIFFPIIVLFYPIPQLTSPKYLLPGIIFLPFLFTKIVITLQERLTKKNFNLIILWLMFFCLAIQIISIQPTFHFPLQTLSVSPISTFPYFIIQPAPTFIQTHDGWRALGAYFRAYNLVRKASLFPRRAMLGHYITDAIVQGCPSKNVTVIFSKKRGNILLGNVHWAYLSNLIGFLQVEGYKFVSPVLNWQNNDEFFLKGIQNIITIKILDEPEFSEYKNSTNDVLIRVPYVSDRAPFEEFYAKLQKFIAKMKTLSCYTEGTIPGDQNCAASF